MRYQVITATHVIEDTVRSRSNGQKDGESYQEEVEGGGHDVSGPWMDVTIIPVVRLEIIWRRGCRWP